MLNFLNKTMNEATALKLASYPFLVAVFTYTEIDVNAVAILAVLLVLDIVTALIRVAIIDPKSYSSRIGIVGVLSKCLTFLIPFIMAIVGKGAGFNMDAFTDMALNVLIVFEGWSVIGNIGQIRSKDASLTEYDAVTFLIRKIQEVFKSFLNNVFKPDFVSDTSIKTTNKPETPKVSVNKPYEEQKIDGE